MPYPAKSSFLPISASYSNPDYASMGNYLSPQPFNQGGGISPPVQAPAPTGTDWGGPMPTGSAYDAMARSLGGASAGNGGGILDTMKGWGNNISELFPSGFLGSTDAKGIKTDGWGGTAIGLANGLMSGYMGMKQYGLSKDILANNKAQFAQNFAAQRGTTNAALSDRQARRVREANANGNPSSATSVADYMAKYGVA